MNKKLIVGAGGYIGNALSILNPDAEVWDCKWTGTNKPKNANMYWKNHIKEYDVIIYLAGLSSVGTCSDLKATFQENVISFSRIIDELTDKQKFIYASSASVYGDNGGNHGTENDRFKHSLTNYDMGMFTRESIAQMANSKGKRTYGLRFGTVAGCLPGQKIIRDNTAINGMVKSAIVNNQIEVSKSWTQRGFICIRDLCNFVDSLIYEYADPGIYNVVSFNSNIEEVSEYIAKTFKVPIIRKEGTNPYNFRMSMPKMKEVYKPNSTLKTVIDDLNQNRKNLIFTDWKEWKAD